ncbi:response regulator [Paenibacillus sp. J5C_2022]|uniref:response regulator n=1 Tax=Paenibacillus sp. J5C2022 TaxID=2977129 RepID=UPI0021D30A1A|nr:response regulator [Paenibacillus sp. J5C2022]MCU6710243.1 response regulator [Paenibacillus sp. J5C2022]
MSIKTILVDDERLALFNLERMISKYQEIEVIGSYMDAIQALEQIRIQQPDAVFLDIWMPGLDGIEAAERVKEISPYISVVFVTAYDDKSVKAFEINALDYLLKPVEDERLEKTVKRLVQYRQMLGYVEPEQTLSSVHFQCMGAMQLVVRNDSADQPTWRTVKVKELLAYLFHHRDQIVSKEALLELLWPNVNEKSGLTNLHTSIYRIRKQLKCCQLEDHFRLQHTDYGYKLTMSGVTVDINNWEQNLSSLKSLSLSNVNQYEEILNAYSGDYFADDNYDWAEIERQRIRSIWIRLVREVGQFYTKERLLTKALRVYHQANKIDPLSPDIMLGILKQYDMLNDSESVEKHYQSYKRLLDKELAVQPDQEIVDWFEGRKVFI